MPTKSTTAVRPRRTVLITQPAPARPVHDHDKDWAILMASVQSAYQRAIVRGDGKMFQTEALWRVWNGLPPRGADIEQAA
jgi:hypothetical protein